MVFEPKSRWNNKTLPERELQGKRQERQVNHSVNRAREEVIQMKPARRTKRNQTSPRDAVDLSSSQPAVSPGAKRAPSSPPPARIGHPRSYSSPLGSAIGSSKAKGKSNSAAADDDDSDFDFAFDKMETSEEDEEDDEDFVEVVRKPPKKKQAVVPSGAAAAPPSARKRAEDGRGAGGRGTGMSRGRGRGKSRGTFGTAAAKNVTAKASKAAGGASKAISGDNTVETTDASVRPARQRNGSGKKASSGRDVVDTDDDDEGGNDSGSSSPQEGDDSEWELDGAGGGGVGGGKGKVGESGSGSGRRRKAGEANGAAGRSKIKEGGRSGSASGNKRQGHSKGGGDDAAGALDEGRGSGNKSDEEFLSTGRKGKTGGDPRGAAEPRAGGDIGSRDRGPSIDLTPDDDYASASLSAETIQRPSTSKAKKLAPAEEKEKGKAKGKGKGKARSNNVLSTAKPAKLAGDVEVVLRRLRRLREDMRHGGGKGPASGSVSEGKGVWGAGDDGDSDGMKSRTLLDLGLGGDVTEVKEMGSAGVMDEIERIIVETALSILEGKGFGFRVPTRSSGNQKYVEELDRIVLGDKVSQRNFVSTAMARKTAITTRVIQLVHQVLGKGIHITKRDMFYTDVKLFREQGESDSVLDDVACMVGCTRSCLNVVASDKGLVVGRVTFLEDGDLIDCTRMGVGGKAIPPYIDKITEVKSDADFILLVEKEAAYMRLAEDRFYQKYPCIVITAKGQPDVATRLFLKRLKRELNIPVMGLVDSDPYGLKILSVYMSGSKNMSYDSASLTTPDIKWLGVRPSDLDRYNIPEQCRLDMTDHDIKTGKELLQEEFIKKSDSWCRELELMIKSKKKAEIQSLSAFGFQYLTHTYLPQKLQNGDWV